MNLNPSSMDPTHQWSIAPPPPSQHTDPTTTPASTSITSNQQLMRDQVVKQNDANVSIRSGESAAGAIENLIHYNGFSLDHTSVEGKVNPNETILLPTSDPKLMQMAVKVTYTITDSQSNQTKQLTQVVYTSIPVSVKDDGTNDADALKNKTYKLASLFMAKELAHVINDVSPGQASKLKLVGAIANFASDLSKDVINSADKHTAQSISVTKVKNNNEHTIHIGATAKKVILDAHYKRIKAEVHGLSSKSPPLGPKIPTSPGASSSSSSSSSSTSSAPAAAASSTSNRSAPPPPLPRDPSPIIASSAASSSSSPPPNQSKLSQDDAMSMFNYDLNTDDPSYIPGAGSAPQVPFSSSSSPISSSQLPESRIGDDTAIKTEKTQSNIDNVLTEFKTTEVAYSQSLNQLKNLANEFILNKRPEFQQLGILLKGRIAPLVEAQSKFMVLLKEADTPEKLNGAFLSDEFTTFSKIAIDLAVDMPDIDNTFKKLCQKYPNDSNAMLAEIGIKGLRNVPIELSTQFNTISVTTLQRIPRYRLLLHELNKYAPVSESLAKVDDANDKFNTLSGEKADADQIKFHEDIINILNDEKSKFISNERSISSIRSFLGLSDQSAIIIEDLLDDIQKLKAEQLQNLNFTNLTNNRSFQSALKGNPELDVKFEEIKACQGFLQYLQTNSVSIPKHVLDRMENNRIFLKYKALDPIVKNRFEEMTTTTHPSSTTASSSPSVTPESETIDNPTIGQSPPPLPPRNIVRLPSDQQGAMDAISITLGDID